ncbi:hypothetical protein [Bradyrhizobium liaoningense]
MAIDEASLNSDLESLVSSYSRLSYDVGGRINFACDLNNDDALRVAEAEKAHLDQAFFVLSFAALESQITSLASARLPDEKRRVAMRAADFEKRWDTAVKVAEETLSGSVPWREARLLVLSWYKIRSDIAHGQSPSALADVPKVINQADEIAATLNAVLSNLKEVDG